MKKQRRQVPLNYDGTRVTTCPISQIFPSVLSKIGKAHGERPDLILASWPEVIGAELAPMTKAVAFVEGKLTVRVKNSTLYSLLSQHDRQKILKSLRQKFPKSTIKDVVFRMG